MKWKNCYWIGYIPYWANQHQRQKHSRKRRIRNDNKIQRPSGFHEKNKRKKQQEQVIKNEKKKK